MTNFGGWLIGGLGKRNLLIKALYNFKISKKVLSFIKAHNSEAFLIEFSRKAPKSFDT
jgi:hypothetical protein